MNEMIIYKYVIDTISSVIEIRVPLWSKLLSCKEQYNKIVFYFMVDTEQERKAIRRFAIQTTGEFLDDEVNDNNFIDTVMLENGNFVAHIFEIQKD